MNSVERTIEKTGLVHKGQVGSLRIGNTDNAVADTLPGLPKDLQDQQPGIVPKAHHGVTVTQLQKLVEGELDIGFATGPINRSGYEQCLIQSEEFVCVTCDNHRFALRDSIRLEERVHEDFVQGSSKDREHFCSYLSPLRRKSGYVPRIVQEAFNRVGIFGLVAYGMGVSVLTDRVRSSFGSGLVMIPLEDVSERLQTMAIWRTDTIDGSREHLEDCLRRASAPAVL